MDFSHYKCNNFSYERILNFVDLLPDFLWFGDFPNLVQDTHFPLFFSSMLTLMETARTMIREALPIKCMEAVVLSISLTNGVPCLGEHP